MASLPPFNLLDHIAQRLDTTQSVEPKKQPDKKEYDVDLEMMAEFFRFVFRNSTLAKYVNKK